MSARCLFCFVRSFLPPRSCCESFLRLARHHVMCSKNVQPFAHASLCYASKDDVYVFDTAAITPFLDANFGALLKLSAVPPSVLSAGIQCSSFALLQISTDGLVCGFALVERLEHEGALFHIKLHANLDGKLLRASCAWARECATRPWTKPYSSLDFSWTRNTTMFFASTDLSDRHLSERLTLNPKRLFHPCMFKSSTRTHSPPVTDSSVNADVTLELANVELDVDMHVDILSSASEIAAAYERDASESAARAEGFKIQLSGMALARVGQERARDDVSRAEGQLAEALATRARADAVFARAEKELREVMKGV